MSSVDNRVVKMDFNNQGFESKVESTMKSLLGLNKTVDSFGNKSKATSGLAKSFAGLVGSVDNVEASVGSLNHKFSALGVAGMSAINRITNSLMNLGSRVISGFTTKPILDGLREYELQLNSVQTILANTQISGTTIADVNKTLDELNTYADKTIYNFGQMTRNIGTFTAAGVGLETSAAAIKGIANLAALSGSNAYQASNAMYQLSQALSAGRVTLMDWNSVVNAGMGGATFQRQLAQTAVAMGTLDENAVNLAGDMKTVTVNGESFRDSISAVGGNSWLTSDVLLNTLKQFTGDLKDAELASMGFTQEQISQIQATAKAAFGAAQDVKTFSQLIETTAEALGSGWAQTWRTVIGDMEEAKQLWTGVSSVIGGAIDRSADARNKLLEDWSEMGGRNDLLEGLKNIFDGLASVVNPVKEAFSDIFPRPSAESLVNATAKFKDLTSQMKLSESAQQSLKSAFSAVFSVVKLGAKSLGSVLSVAGSMLGVVAPLAGVFLDVAGAIGKFVTNITNAIDASGIMNNIASRLKGALDTIGNAISNSLGKIDASTITNIMGAISTAISSAILIFGESLKQINKYGGEMVKTFGLIAGGAGLTKLISFFKDLGSVTDLFSGLFGAQDFLSDLGGVLRAYQNDIKADVLMRIAKAIGILAVSVLLLSTINPDKAASSLATLGAMLLELAGAMKLMTLIAINPLTMAKVYTSLLAMSVAILILSAAMKNLSGIDWGGIARGLVGLAGVMALMVGVMKVSNGAALSAPKGIFSMIAMALSIKILASALEDISQINWGGIAKGLVGMAGVALILTTLSTTMGGVGVMSGLGMIAIAQSLRMMADAVKSFSDIDAGGIAKATIAISALLGVITVFSTMSAGGATMIGAGLGLTVMAKALGMLATSLSGFGSMDLATLVQGVIGMASALTVLGVALTMMAGALPGAFALMVAAGAISILVPPLMALGSMDIWNLVQALGFMAATFTTIGVAGLLLAPVIPALMGLSVALMAIGLAALTFGVGVTLITGGIMAISLAISTLAQLTTDGVQSIIDNMVLMVEGVAENVSRLSEAFKTIGESILGVIVDLTPQIVEAFMVILDELLKSVADHVPSFIESGKTIMTAVASGIVSEMMKPVESMIKTMAEIINKIVEKYPALQSAGQALANALGFGIGSGEGAVTGATGQVVSAGVQEASGRQFEFRSIGGFMMSGLAGGILGAAGSVSRAILSVVGGAIAAAKAKLGIASPSKEFYKIGEFVVEGLAGGLGDPSANAKVVEGIQNLVKEMKQEMLNLKVDDGANLVIAAGVANAKDLKKIYAYAGSAMENMIARYSNYEEGVYDAVEATKSFTEALYMNSDMFERDKESIRNTNFEIQKLVAERKELNEALKSAKDNKEADKIKRDIESTTNSINSKIEEIERNTRSVSDNIRKTFENLKNGITKSVDAFLNPLKMAMDSVDIFSGFKAKPKDDDDSAFSDYNSSYSSETSSNYDDTNRAKAELDKAQSELDKARQKSEAVEGRSQRFLDDIARAEERVAAARENLDNAVERTTTIERESSQSKISSSEKHKEALEKEKEEYESILDVMQRQVNEYKAWRADLALLSGLDLAPGLMDQLKDMGIKGAEHVKAFVNMTKEEIDRANQLYLESTSITTDSMIDNYKKAYATTKEWSEKIRKLQEAGLDSNILTDLVEQGPDGMAKVEEFISMTGDQIKEINQLYRATSKLSLTVTENVLASLISSSNTLGKTMTEGVGAGVEEGSNTAIPVVEEVGKATLGALEGIINEDAGIELGLGVTEGMERGLQRGESAVTAMARRVAIAAFNAAKAALGVHSPSRKFAELGKFSMEGFALGLEKSASDVASTASKIGTNVLGAVRQAVNGEAVSSITPVVDLTNAKKSVAQLSQITLTPDKTSRIADRAYSEGVSGRRNQNGSTQLDQSSHTTTNEYQINVYGEDPETTARKVAEYIQTDVERREAVWDF